MSSEWEHLTIGELVRMGEASVQTGPFGSQLHKHDYTDEGVPVIPTEAIGRGRILDIDVPKISRIKANELARHQLLLGDILFARRGAQATGLSAIVDSRYVGALCGTGALLLRVNSQRVDPSYLSMFLSSTQAFEWLRMHAVGAVMPNLNTDIIKALPITLPSLSEQRELAAFHGALGDRITLLRETNATLEDIAQTLFKSWFVDFDPVRAKAEGFEPEGMDATTAARFPDSFEESELGLVPRGWKTGCVADIAVQRKGAVNPLAAPNEWFEHYSLPAFDSGQSPVLEQGESIKSNKTPLPEDAVLLSKLNPRIPRVWLPVKHGGNAVCSTEFLAYSPRAGGSKELIYCLFSSAEFQQQLCQLVTGTSNSHQRVKPDQVLKLRLAIADDSLLIAFADIASPIFERVYVNRLKAQTLTQLRATLLPRLISGQLRLPETEASIENMLLEAI